MKTRSLLSFAALVVFVLLAALTKQSGLPGAVDTRVSIDTVATGLNVPWEMIWGPDNQLWITEQSGTISRIDPGTGKKTVLVAISDVYRMRSLGLLGMALHPDFVKNPYVFVDYTSKKDSANLVCKLVRYTYKNGRLAAPKILLEFPAGTGHNGSRIVISPDKKIMFATGDAASLSFAQDKNSLNGKVLRLNLDGSVPADNPIKGSYVWSLGHRNIQGLTYDNKGRLFASEHGDAIEDELNIIGKGNNYGWIKVEGYCDQPAEKQFCDSVKVTEPIKAWTPTIAPAAVSYYSHAALAEFKNSILLTTLKEADLRVLTLDVNGEKVVKETIYFDQLFGRIRAVCQSPNGDIYLSTSNRDWNPGKGFPKHADDRIVRIRKSAQGLPLSTYAYKNTEQLASSEKQQAGKRAYKLYCASCHKEDGLGVAGSFPPLKGAEYVTGDKQQFLKVMLKGLTGEITVLGQKYDQHMPAFGFLKDQDAVDIANYVRVNFGGQSSPVELSDMSEARK